MKSVGCCWLFTIAFSIVVTTASAKYECSSGGTDYDYVGGPIIDPCKKEIVLQHGQNFTISCKGKTPIKFKQQEVLEESIGLFSMTEKNLISTDKENPYEVALHLLNVNQYAVGYYACYHDSIDIYNIFNDLSEEPDNTESVTYIYVYVNGTEVLFAPTSEFLTLSDENQVLIPCRPTSPDITMTLSVVDISDHIYDNNNHYENYDPKLGITISNDDLPDDVFFIKCYASSDSSTEQDFKLIHVMKRPLSSPTKVKIDKPFDYFMAGENFTINCSVKYQPNSAIALSWELPRDYSQDTLINVTNECNVATGESLYNAITIVDATEEDSGNYTCVLNYGPKNKMTKTAVRKFLEKSFISLKKTNSDDPIITEVKKIKLKAEVKGYPPPKFFFYRDNEALPADLSKYITNMESATGDVALTILNFTVRDTANYTIFADNGYVTNSVKFDVRKLAAPVVDFGPRKDRIYLENTENSLYCEADGYPLPNIEWIFSNDKKDAIIKGKDKKLSEFKVSSLLDITAKTSGNITCKASNMKGISSESRRFLVYEVPNGFGVLDKQQWYSENHKVYIRCLASIYKFENATWLAPDGAELIENVIYYQNSFSHVAKLKIEQVSLDNAGIYTCVGRYSNSSAEYESTPVFVEAVRNPNISEPQMDRDEDVMTFQPVQFSCVADAVPTPNIEWYKDGILLVNNTDGLVIYHHKNRTVVNSTIWIERMSYTNKGKYECLATSEGISASKFVNLNMKDSTPLTPILGVVGAVILLLIVLVIYLTWKIRKEKKFRKELAAAGLLYFKEGVTKSLNPELGIDEQAELLPYDEKFEFPPDKLTLGVQLGAGAFGVVYKAEARGIKNAEESTTVAVKMVKKTADNMYIKALASELKIMVHLGKHVNIVNLLGACTKNVGKRELIVIVEYCKFGNIHNYMHKHRDVFIDQLTDTSEKFLGRINKGYSCSSASSGVHSDYFGMNHTQATDHTTLNTASTSRSERKVSETGYVQPEWRSNYESDYSFDGRSPRPLTSRDLLAWAFQIARGMEYLVNRKVLHGDLAARNVLLAEDNIVKICDFGLARSIYKNDEYKKKENSPLPVKWLAIECMTDQIFSTQSDVWSFGIVLWEMFSLAKTPYPNMSPQHLLNWLNDGHRLEKPAFADDRLYNVMKRCWEHKPSMRPSFTQLQELLGSFLEDNVRNHYVDLNSAYMDLNVENEGKEDYLAMMCAPDYNNLVTPSPHHYMNDVRSFFPPTPTQVPLDEEGYLQMTPANPSIFSPRAQSTKFDFDARKLTSRVSDERGGSELTPMLTLNNLPARSSSESDDHDGGYSPYLNMCPKIIEETDDVFSENENQFKNVHNNTRTNPTYMSMNIDIEKKPQNNINYINVPNGLVK